MEVSTTADLSVSYQPIGAPKFNPRNSRTHSNRQIRQIADSIKTFGFTNPVLVDSTNTIIAGHGRVQAAKLLGLDRVPTIRLESLTENQIRAYIIADNRLAENAGWDEGILAIELQHLLTIDEFNIRLTGFEVPEIDLILQENSVPKRQDDSSKANEGGPAITQPGDIWQLDEHLIQCGRSLEKNSFVALDVAIRRWQRYTGGHAVHVSSGKSFDEVTAAGGSNV